MREPTVSAGIVSGLAAYAASRGAQPAKLYEAAGIDPDLLEDADNRVAFAAYRQLMRSAAAACADPDFALHFAEAVDMSEVSIVGLIMNASATMGEAFRQMQRFGRLAIELKETGGTPRYQLVHKSGALWMADTHPEADEFPELCESAFARLVCGPRRFLSQPHILEVHFRRAAPADRREYDRIFGCPVQFSSDWNAMRLAPGMADWPVALQPHYVFGVLTDRADTLLREMEAVRTARGEVEAAILPVLHTGEVSAHRIAAMLGVSRQTLFRRLKAEGTSFKAVLDALRCRMATDYLRGQKASVNETAYLVGFSDPPAFSRAYKRWTGQSPRDIRNTLR